MRDIQQVFAGNNPHQNSESKNNRFNEVKRSDEIDLIEVLSFLVRTIKRYKVLILSSVILAIVVGFAVNQFLSPTAKKELVCRISNIDRQAVSTMLVEFESNIKGAEEGPIKNLKAVQLKEGADGLKENEPFIIEGKFAPNADVAAIQNLLVSHIENNPFVKSQVENEREKMKKMVEMLKADERKIAALLSNAENLESESFSIADMSKLKMDFYKERIALESKMKTYSAIEVVQNFTGKEPSAAKSAILVFGVSLLVCLFLAASIIAVREVSIAINRYERRMTIAENGFNVSRGIAEQIQQKKVSSI